MTGPTLTLEPATLSTIDRIRSLLAANDLPTADVSVDAGQFYVARADGTMVGAGGLEQYGPNALLRSLVVEEPYRGAGHGAAICTALEQEALTSGVTMLFLLTTTAAPFFRSRGYEDLDRADVPARIRQTAEFADLCPDAATCLGKRLD